MHHFIRILLPAVFLLSLGVAFASTTLTDEKVISGLGKNVDILEDSTGALNIHQVTTPEYAARFRPSREAAPNLGYTRSAIWVRFKLKNLTFSDPWVLQAAFPDMDNVELYSGEGSNWEVQELGQALAFSSRKIINRDLLFQLFLIAHQAVAILV